MTEKRYYCVDYDEQYYIFDSDVIRKGRVEEEAEYSYDVFADSMTGDEVVNKLNELSKENEKLKCKVNGLKSELSIWKEDANEHIQETNKLFEENKQLKQAYQTLKSRHSLLHDECLEAECDRDSLKKDVISLEKENENLNNVLEDFMVMLNRLQAEPNNKSLQGMARDMLRLMGKNVRGDSE